MEMRYFVSQEPREGKRERADVFYGLINGNCFIVHHLEREAGREGGREVQAAQFTQQGAQPRKGHFRKQHIPMSVEKLLSL